MNDELDSLQADSRLRRFFMSLDDLLVAYGNLNAEEALIGLEQMHRVTSELKAQTISPTNCEDFVSTSTVDANTISIRSNDTPSSQSRRSRRKPVVPRKFDDQYASEDDTSLPATWPTDSKISKASTKVRGRKVYKAGDTKFKVVTDFKGDERFQCNNCELKFSYYAALLRHCEAVHQTFDANKKIQEINRNAVTCEQCGTVLSSKGALHAHMQKHTGEQPFNCETCLKKFSLKSNLLRHQRIHKGLKPYECDICQKKFTEKRSVEVHRRIHTGEKPYSCGVCGMKFSQLGSWIGHKDTHKTNDQAKYECDECGKILSQKVGLYNHKRRHHEKIRNHACKQCEMTFYSVEELRQHELVHSGKKPFLCSLCGKTFARQQTFKNHMAQHDDEQKFQCPYCPEKLKTNYAFTKHKKMHPEDSATGLVLNSNNLSAASLQKLPGDVIHVYCSDGKPPPPEILEALAQVQGLQ